jgi:hypothetical protein
MNSFDSWNSPFSRCYKKQDLRQQKPMGKPLVNIDKSNGYPGGLPGSSKICALIRYKIVTNYPDTGHALPYDR